MSDQDTTITADGLEQMLDQFRGATNLRKLATTYLDQVQAFEDAAWPLLGERSIDNATGHRLDGLGQIVNIDRGGRNDADYRLRLKAEFLILSSSGNAEQMLAIAQALVQMTTADYELTENFPKGLVIRPVDFAVTSGADAIGAGLKRATSAGTSTHFVYSEKDDSETFVMLGSDSWNPYKFDVTTTAGAASTYFRFNSATPASITEIYISQTDNDSEDEETWLSGLTSLVVPSENGWFEFDVTSSVDSGSYFTLSVTDVTLTGAVPDLNEVCALFANSSVSGLPGLASATGNPWQFDDVTVSGASAGFFRFNSATLADVTTIWISQTDGDSEDEGTFLTGLASGGIAISSPSGWYAWDVSTSNDSGIYFTVSVSNGTFSGTLPTDLDECTIFSTGATGGHLSGVT